MSALIAVPARKLTGRLRAPADKSISQRALILSALSIGKSHIKNLLSSADVGATARALQQLGIAITAKSDHTCTVQGLGVGGLRPPQNVLDFDNSGTGARLMLGVMATHPHIATFTGDASLVQRPMKRVLAPLAEFGATALAREGGYFPLTLEGAINPVPVRHHLEVPSAQVKSAVLLAGLNAPGETIVIEPIPTRDHTERMLPCFGGKIRLEESAGERAIHLTGQVELQAAEIEIPGDASSAAFLLAAALITPDSEVVIENVGINPQRVGVFTSLLEMGADIEFLNPVTRHGEPVADIRARCGKQVHLQGVHIKAERAASMIDEYPILAVVAAFAKGESQMEGLAELRVKESDRLDAITRLLRANGVQAESGPDNLYVQGRGKVAGGGTVETRHDHRIAMASLVLGLGARREVAIDDDRMIATSFPTFRESIVSMGGDIHPA